MNNHAPDIMEQGFHLSTTQDLLYWTSEETTTKAQAIVTAVADGEADPMEEYIKVRKAKAVLDEAEKNLKPYFDGLSLNKNEVYFGCEISEREMGVKYDCSACGDIEWEMLDAQIKNLTDQLKAREKFLKALDKPTEAVNTQTGETYTIRPAVKTGKMGKALSIR